MIIAGASERRDSRCADAETKVTQQAMTACACWLRTNAIRLVCIKRRTRKPTPAYHSDGLYLLNLGRSHRISSVSATKELRACLELASSVAVRPVPRSSLWRCSSVPSLWIASRCRYKVVNINSGTVRDAPEQ